MKEKQHKGKCYVSGGSLSDGCLMLCPNCKAVAYGGGTGGLHPDYLCDCVDEFGKNTQMECIEHLSKGQKTLLLP